ncbi:MAG TPA: DUF4153 domain-containing protein, partial [Lysobacter sp.]
MTAAFDLPARTRPFVVLVALLQGLALYLAETGHKAGRWPFDALTGRVCWYTLVLTVPTLMTLSVLELRDRRFWQHALAAGAIFAVLAWWAASNAGAPGVDSSAVLAPFGFTTAVGLFIALPYLQCRLAYGRWHAPYADLFEHAWQNTLTLMLTAVFTGICWAVLALWGELFGLIGIRFFKTLFREQAFVYLATGTMVGLGILIGRTQHRPVRVARQIVFAVFTGLLPLLAAIMLAFVASLPFTGLDALWSTRSATAILLGVLIVLSVFLNAVFQDGTGDAPYPRWLRRVVDAGLAFSPVYAALALYALWLRIDQYGWTAERLWAALLALVLAGHACGYAAAALRGRDRWLRPLPRVNVALSLAAIALVLAVNSPVLDPHRVAVRDQLARIRDGRTPVESIDFEYLRFGAGRIGYEAAQALRREPALLREPARLAELESVLKRAQRHVPWQSDEELRRTAVTSVADARRLVRPAANAAPLDEAWLRALAAQQLDLVRCLQPDRECVALTPDLDRDGVPAHLLCD